MLFFNVFTRLQVGLISGIVALAAPGAQAADPAPALEQLVEADEGDASEPELLFTDEGDPTEARRWRCYDDDDREWRGYCLVRCEDDDDGHGFDKDEYRRVTDKIRIRGNRDYCRHRARRACRGRGGVDDWCFGDRRWDDDDDDDGHGGGGGHRD